MNDLDVNNENADYLKQKSYLTNKSFEATEILEDVILLSLLLNISF